MGVCSSNSNSNERRKESKYESDYSNYALTEFTPRTNVHIIADDVKDNRYYLSIYLKLVTNNLVRLIECKNGQEVLNYDDINNVDIVWMDLRMPVLDGIECARRLRDRGCGVYIIAVTGDVSELNIRRCYESGINSIQVKPVMLDYIKALDVITKINIFNQNSI